MIFAWIGALLIGLSLGMLGSGGSAITVPILVYLLGHGAKVAIAESMAIVGLISAAISVPYARAGQIDWRSVWFFGIPGMVGTFGGASLGGLAPNALQLLVFGAVLLVSATMMLRNRSPGAPQTAGNSSDADDSPAPRPKIWQIGGEGLLVGIMTGFIGVGGGFLIVPALVLLGGLSMRMAIGTSLVIIAANSTVGFAKYEYYLLTHDSNVDVSVIVLFVVLGIVGSYAGRLLNQRLNQATLKRVFAIFLILLGGFVMVREGSRLFSPSNPPAPVSNLDAVRIFPGVARRAGSTDSAAIPVFAGERRPPPAPP